MKSSTQPGDVYVQVGIATAIDTFLLLQLKRDRFVDQPEKLQFVLKELEMYTPIIDDIVGTFPQVREVMTQLRELHERLWGIEDRKRTIEQGENEHQIVVRLCDPGNEAQLHEYLTLARQVSLYNDRRASLKNKINELTGSVLRDVKSHKTVA